MELIQIERRELIAGQFVETVSARDLWEFLGVKDKFTDWLFARLDKYQFVAEMDYLVRNIPKEVPHQGGIRSIINVEYFLTIETAKELAMVQNNDKGREIRRYFIECERRAKAAAAAPVVPASQPGPSAAPFDPETFFNDPAKTLNLLLNYTERLVRAENVIKEQQPKVAALNRIAECTNGSLCIMDAAKVLQVKPKDLFIWLQGHDWTYKRVGCSSWKAYSTRLKQGYLEHKISTLKTRDVDGLPNEKVVEQVRITPKGLAYLSEVFSRPLSKAQPMASQN